MLGTKVGPLSQIPTFDNTTVEYIYVTNLGNNLSLSAEEFSTRKLSNLIRTPPKVRILEGGLSVRS